MQLGLDAEQVMLPLDHLTLPEANALPALVVTLLPNGMTHFVVIWRRHGALVQVMDPAQGRCFLTWSRFTSEIYLHTYPIPAAEWRAWAGSEESLAPLRHRLKLLSDSDVAVAALIAHAAADPGWRGLAALDAATRLVTALVKAEGVQRGEQATALLERFSADPNALKGIPQRFWFALPAPGEPDPASPETPEQVLIHGAVLVRINGVHAAAPETLPPESWQPSWAKSLRTPCAPFGRRCAPGAAPAWSSWAWRSSSRRWG